jgi:acetoin utilization protein AcuB
MRRVDEMMTTGALVTVRPTATVSEVVRLIAQRDVSHVIVLDHGELVGIVCACDLDDAGLQAEIGVHMNRSPQTIPLGASAFAAARCMLEQGISCLPVMRDADVVGIVTLSDMRRTGVLERTAERCSACGDGDHVRSTGRDDGIGFCLECRRRSVPPSREEDLGGD